VGKRLRGGGWGGDDQKGTDCVFRARGEITARDEARLENGLGKLRFGCKVKEKKMGSSVLKNLVWEKERGGVKGVWAACP